MKSIISIISIGVFALFLSCTKPDQILRATSSSITYKINEASTYCNTNDFNNDFCILIDMNIHSGKKRFFIINLKTKKVEKSYLVSHGCGENSWGSDESKTTPKFSNTNDSHLSSLGKYSIGNRGWSNWGVNVNYSMHGLEATNANANAREIVFHSWHSVSDEEVYPSGTPEGWGCPAVSNNAFLEIDLLLKNATKPVLMWIYNDL